MEGLFAFGVLLAGWVLLIPIIALIKAGRARREAELARHLVVELQNVVHRLNAKVASLTAAATTAARPVSPPLGALVPPLEAGPPVVAPLAASLTAAAATEPIAEAQAERPAAFAPPRFASEAPARPTPPLTPTPPLAPAPPAPAKTGPGSLEETIALVWFTRIGAVAVLLGAAYFFKYAVDNDWIGPLGRVAIGALLGVLTLIIAERSRPTTRPLWTQVMLGVGLGFLLLSSYASHAFYHLVPVQGAFAAFFIVCCLGGVLAVRDDAPSTLVISLAAALAAPVLLSTGVDRPAALFAYLLVVSGLAFVASLLRGFRVAFWLAVVGPIALFVGWYDRFYEINPASIFEDQHLPAGAYFAVSSRLAPLLALPAFTAAWLVCHLQLQRRGRKLEGTILLLVAAVAAHTGLTALLYDHVHTLAFCMTALAVPFIVFFRRAGRTDLLAWPLLTAFGLLAGTLHMQRAGTAPSALGALGIWALAYVVAIGVRPKTSSPTTASTRDSSTAWLASPVFQLGAVLIAFLIFGVLLLVEKHAVGLTVLIAALSTAYVGYVLAQRAWQAVLAFALAISGVFWLSLVDYQTWDPTLLASLAGWAAVYIAAVAFLLFVRRAPITPPLVAVSSLAGLAFLALAWQHGAGERDLLVAALFGAVGAIDLALALGCLRREGPAPSPEARAGIDVWLAQALGLFATAFAFLLAGPALTLAWAALGAVAVSLGARRKDLRWLMGGCLVLGATAIRLLTIDGMVPEHQYSLFHATGGHQGSLAPAFLLNGRAYAAVGFAVACFVAARFTSRIADEAFRRTAAALAFAAHASLLVLAVLETRARALPVLARPLENASEEVWSAFYSSQVMAMGDAHARIAMAPTLVMGIYGGILLAIGFGAREIFHRYLGLFVFALAVAKLALWDVWNLARFHQILVLVAMGGLLLGASFLYARWGRRLVSAFLKPSEPEAAAPGPSPSPPLEPPV